MLFKFDLFVYLLFTATELVVVLTLELTYIMIVN